MNHRVPDFEIHIDDEDYPLIPMPSATKKPSISMGGEEIMELLWQNGQVVMQSQNHRPLRKPPPPERNSDTGPSTTREIRPEVENYNNQHLFMQEDEMTSWLHYPIDDQDLPLDQTFGADLLYAPPMVNANKSENNNNNHNSAMQTLARTSQLTEQRHPPRTVAPRPPIPPPRRPEQAARANMPNFGYFSKHNARAEPGPSSSSKNVAKENTVVDSCDTPFAMAAAEASRFSETLRSSADPTEWDGGRGSMTMTTSAGGGRGTTTCGMTMTSSPGGSSSSGELVRRVATEDRKRKGREEEEWELQSEDVDFESAEARKQVHGSTTKRSRAAEVHNLSERRRRDRINEKMRALQELIPRCNKSDKASMLDEAIEYLKSLQLQVQMMSMGCSMVPMMFAGMQQYMPTMGMGIGMGMEMGMNRPVMPFPNMLAGSALPAATAAAHLGPRFPMPPFHMQHVPAPDSSRMQAANQTENNMLTSVGTPDPNQSCIPNFTDPYQQYLGPQQMQFQLMQILNPDFTLNTLLTGRKKSLRTNQAMNQLNVSKPSTSRGPENPEKHQSG